LTQFFFKKNCSGSGGGLGGLFARIDSELSQNGGRGVVSSTVHE
jgi:hypothetical protein